MNLTNYIPLQLRHYEIGQRTLLAILLTCSTLMLLSFLAFFVWLSPNKNENKKPAGEVVKTVLFEENTPIPNETNVNVSPDKTKAKKPPTNAPITELPKTVAPKANNFYNLSAVLSPDALKRRGASDEEIEDLRTNCEKYVERYAPVAIVEMKKFGIPASIKLAQGLLESDAGNSRLAKSNNNHFGIKCFSKRCRKGHCSNFTDDSHKDFFRAYESVWESYRAHSHFLEKDRYAKCFKKSRKDYKGWAKELRAAGYATDPKYTDKLIAIIEELSLWQFDK